jgi:hypothetical protein
VQIRGALRDGANFQFFAALFAILRGGLFLLRVIHTTNHERRARQSIWRWFRQG